MVQGNQLTTPVKSFINVGFAILCLQATVLIAQPLSNRLIPEYRNNNDKAIRENMGPAINSPFDESAPVISPDGHTLYFWSMDRPDGKGLQDIYYSKWDSSSGSWSLAQNIGRPLNNENCNMVLSVSPDNSRLLVYSPSKIPGHTDLGISQRMGGGWTAPSHLRIQNYVNNGQSSISAYLGADGKTLILSIEGKDTKGEEDLYVSFLGPDYVTWSEPKHLGPVINTEHSESTPFLAADGVTLYFSTDKPGGLGGEDIYMTTRLDDSWQHWTTPVNLGSGINTPSDDYYFKFSAAADYGYLVSTDNSIGGKDIFRVKLPESIKPKPVLLINGVVRDKDTKQPLNAKITYSHLADGTEIGKAEIDEKDGKYKIILPSGKQYAYMAELEG
ncbi:MAG: hypothetical protein NZ108_07385, partial [Bacteroidia bacterium]|nr:hypothetical protein [Bacteroidia bacterium]